jgi:hypothetical protein
VLDQHWRYFRVQVEQGIHAASDMAFREFAGVPDERGTAKFTVEFGVLKPLVPSVGPTGGGLDFPDGGCGTTFRRVGDRATRGRGPVTVGQLAVESAMSANCSVGSGITTISHEQYSILSETSVFDFHHHAIPRSVAWGATLII